MTCPFCSRPPGGEHHVTCPLYEPGLTQEEIRAVRRLLQVNGLVARPAESIPKHGG